MNFSTTKSCQLLTDISLMIECDPDLQERRQRAVEGHETKEDDISSTFEDWSIDFPSRGKQPMTLTVEVKHTTQNGVGKVGRLTRKNK